MLRLIVAVSVGIYTAALIMRVSTAYDWHVMTAAYITGVLAFVMGTYLICNPDGKGKDRS